MTHKADELDFEHMPHPIDPMIIESIEILADSCPDVQSGDCWRQEVIDHWTELFHQHARSAVERAALHCETRAVQEDERANELLRRAKGFLRDGLGDVHFYYRTAETANANARVCRTLAAEIRLLGKP